MANLVRRNPMNVPTFDPFFRSFFSPLLGENLFGPMVGFSNEQGTRTWTPPVDIQETDNAYQVYAELPGLSKKDVDITVESNMLTLSGERKWHDERSREGYRRMERAYGKFSRTFQLPQTVRPEDVEARFENGLLLITIPKAEEARPRKIAIN